MESLPVLQTDSFPSPASGLRLCRPAGHQSACSRLTHKRMKDELRNFLAKQDSITVKQAGGDHRALFLKLTIKKTYTYKVAVLGSIPAREIDQQCASLLVTHLGLGVGRRLGWPGKTNRCYTEVRLALFPGEEVPTPTIFCVKETEVGTDAARISMSQILSPSASQFSFPPLSSILPRVT